ncbi:hypothetical protein D3C71_1895370 [compost metagenome]
MAHRFLDSMQLLSNVHALTTLFDHGNDAAQVTVCTFKVLDDRLVTLMGVGMVVFVLTHDLSLRPQ